MVFKVTEPAEDRFWQRVNKDGPTMPHMDTPCWMWTGGHSVGYGVIVVFGKSVGAHRFSWELHNGPIPNKLWVLHKCDNRECTRPDHLFLGTCADNEADKKAKGRQAKGSRHGMHVHPESRATGERHGSRTHPEALPKGEEHWKAKLTTKEVIEIREAWSKGGVTKSRLAIEYHVSESTIAYIIKRKIWKHI